jgi:hypothetical protein
LLDERSEEATLAKASPLDSLHPPMLFQRTVVLTLVLALSIAGYPAEALAAQDAGAVQVDTSPAGLDHLLAPIALYPDALLMQVLAASVNSQEVLDAGNWLLENKALQGTQIDDAAKKLGFGAATIALLHFPDVVDLMCTQLDWTKQLGVAFTQNQAGVLDAVQRLRAQAVQYGNLKSSEQQKVETQTDNGKQVIVIQPATPQVVYVPQYNPQTVYVQSSGPSTGDVVAASVISFGLGVAVGAMFSSNNYYSPRWGYGGVYYGGRPWYPHGYVYRPVYGPGWRPPNYYRPPANYPYHRVSHYNNNYWNNNNYRGGNNTINRGGNNTVNIGNGNNNNNRPGNGNGYNKPGNGNNNNRPGNGNNNGYNKPSNGNNNNAGNNRPGGSNNGGGYNKPGNGNNNNAGNNRPGGNNGGNNGSTRPGNTGGSGGGNSRPPNNATRPAPDRGYGKPAGGANQAQPRPGGGNQSRPGGGGNQAQTRPAPQARPAQAQPRQAPAFSGGGQSGRSAQAASQRGAASNAGRKR